MGKDCVHDRNWNILGRMFQHCLARTPLDFAPQFLAIDRLACRGKAMGQCR